MRARVNERAGASPRFVFGRSPRIAATEGLRPESEPGARLCLKTCGPTRKRGMKALIPRLRVGPYRSQQPKPVSQTQPGARPLTGAGIRSILFLIAIVAIVNILASPLPAQGVAVRRVFVPVDRPEDWPAGDWRPVPLVDLESFLTSQRTSATQKPVLLRAEYTATLAGNELTDGQLSWQIHRLPGEADLELAPFGLGVGKLRWEEPDREPRPAVWGSTPAQRVALRLDGDERRLSGSWSLRGRKIGEHVLFEAEFPKATSTQFRLRLPEGWALRSSVGDVQQAADGAWEVRLGGQTRVQWTVHRAEATAQPSSILVLQESEYRLRQDGLMLRTAITPEVRQGPIRELVLSIDPNLDVLSITTPDGTSLSWQPADARGNVAVKLPEPLQGAGPRLHVNASGTFPSGRRALLPQIRVAGGQLMASGDDPSSGRIAVRVTAPLQLQDLRLEGCRQVDMSAASDEERFVFRQFDPVSQIEAEVSPARWRATGRVLTWLERDAGTWLSRTACEWSVRAGSAFDVSCRVAAGWDVIDVRVSGAGTKPDWSLTDQDGERRLTVWFREPFSAGQVQRLFVDARRFTEPAAIDLPVISPRDVSQGEVLVGLPRDEANRLLLDAETTFAPVTPTPAWSELQTLALAGESGAAWMQSSLLAARGQWTARAPLKPLQPPSQIPGVKPAEQRSLELVVSNAALHVRCALDGADLYRATFRVHTDGSRRTFRFVLPEGTELSDVRTNAERVVPESAGTRYRVRLPAGRTSHTVEVHYRVPVRESFTLVRRPLLLPRIDVPVFGMRLTVEPEPDAWIGELQGMALDSAGPVAARWLGPFAQGRRFAPEGNEFSALRASAGTLPASCSVAICHSGRRQFAAWAVCGLTLLLGVVLRLRAWWGRSLMASIALVTVAALGVLLPEATALFAGSVNVGIWLALLLPQRWLVPRRTFVALPPQPGLSAARAVVVTGLLAAVLCGAVLGQEPMNRFVVLIPVDDGEQPAGDAPLAYVPPELEARLRGPAAPRADAPWRIRSMTYELELDAVRRPIVRAVCSVGVRPGDAPASILLPITQANLAGEPGCTVDGRPHPVLPGPAGGFMVVLDPVAAGEDASAERLHDIALRVYPQADPEHRGAVRMGVPACPNASLVRSDSAVGSVRVVTIHGSSFAVEAKLPEDGPLALGPASQFRLVLGDDAGTRAPMAELSAQAFTLCDVHPGLAFLQTRHVCRVTAGQVDAVSLQLPPGASVRDVQAADLLRWDVVGSGPQRRLNVAWQRPQSGEFALRVVWTLPRSAEARELAIPPGSLGLESASNVRVSAQSQFFGWRRPLDLELDVHAAGDPSAVQPRTPEQFQTGFPGEAARPAGAFEAAAPAGWSLELRRLAQDAVARPRQTISVFPDRVHVAYEADVEASTALLFQHRIAIPANVTIEDVRVVQNGVEQPVRWSRLPESLIVVLRDRAIKQTLIVTGLRSGAPLGDLAVALWQPDGVVSFEPEVVIWQSPELRVDVDMTDLPAIPFPPENIPPIGAAVSVGAYESRTWAPVRLQVARADLRWSVEMTTEIDRQGESLDLASALRFRGDLVAGGSVMLVLPPPLAGVAELQGRDVILLSRSRQPDGTERCEIGIPPDPGAGFTINVLAQLPRATERQELPGIEVPGAAEITETAVIRADGLTLAAEAPAKVERRPGGEAGRQRFRIERGGGAVSVAEQREPVRLPATAEVVYWKDAGEWHGRMRITAEGRGGRVVLRWPSAIRPDSALVDGRVVAVPDMPKERFEQAVPPGAQTAHDVRMTWRVPANAASVFLPDVEGSSQNTATFVPAEGSLLWMSGGVPVPENRRPADVPPFVVSTLLDGSAPTLRSIDADAARRVTAIVLAAGVGLLIVIACGARWPEVIQRRPWLAALLLAGVWAAVLTPWWLGLIFPAVALVESWLLWRDPPQDLPSTVTVMRSP